MVGKTTNKEEKLTFKIKYSIAMGAFSSFTFGVSLTSIEAIYDVCKDCNITSRGIYNGCVLMNNTQWSTFVSIYTLSALLATLLINQININLKKKIILNNLLYLGGTVCIFTMTNFYLLIVGRILTGLAIGITCSVIPLYLGMMAPDHLRGVIGSTHQIGIVSGVLAGQIISYFYGQFDNWRVGYIGIIGYIVIHTIALFDIYNIELTNDSTEEHKSVLDLVKLKKARRSVITAILIHLGQQLSCINGVLFFSNKIMAKTQNPKLNTIILGVMSLISSAITMVFIDKMGRKPLILASCLVVIISLVMLSYEILVSYALYIFIIGFNFGLGPVTWFLTGEIFPIQYKRAGATIAVSVNWLSTFIIGMLFLKIVNLFGNMSFMIFAFATASVAAYFYFYYEETKGKKAEFQKN